MTTTTAKVTTTKDRWNAYKVTLPVLEQLSVRVYNAWHAENGNDGIEPTS